ncbi:MAG: hypothetical protein ABFE07_19760 [Armatimonadia bacterium]
MSSSELDPRLVEVSSRLRYNWLSWGVLPLAVFAVLTLFVAAFQTAAPDLSAMQMERRFQVILAISAGLFLIGFSLDSHWTSAQKLARRLSLLAGLDLEKAQKPSRKLAEQADLVFESILSSSLALTVIGAAIGLMAILAAAARLGMSYSVMMLLVAAAYQLFVFSRHSYYREVMEAAAAGKLVFEPKK